MKTNQKIILAWQLFSGLLLFACNSQPTTDETKPTPGQLALKPGKDKSYSFSVLTVADRDSSKDLSGDSVLFEFELVPGSADAQSIPMTMIIKHTEIHTALRHNLPKQKKELLQKQDVFITVMEDYFVERDSLLNALSDDSLQLLVDHNGNVLKVSGFENIVQRMQNRFPENTVVKRILEDIIGDQAIRDLFSNIFFYLPEGSTQTSGSWVRNYVLVAKAPVKHSNMISVTGARNDSVLLDIRSRISAGEEVEPYMTGEKSGVVIVNSLTGLPLSMSLGEQTVTKSTAGTETRRQKLTSVTSQEH